MLHPRSPVPWRICRDNRWWSVFGKKRGRSKEAGPPVHDDLVRRDFTATCANRLWLTDITEHVEFGMEGSTYLLVRDYVARRPPPAARPARRPPPADPS